jgi:hypothetical protein
MSIAISGSSITFPDQTQMSTAVGGSFRNRIINGDMRIDQRNAGASVSVTNGTVTYITDRWNVYEDTSGSISSQRSTTAPDGYSNSILISVVGSGSATAAQACRLQQRIEGFNFSDLAFGTSSAQSVSISFWVRSSLTGTYSVSIRNGTVARSYVATYTISSANTWERKTVTITGDTSGTWITDNGVGAIIDFDLGSGSNSNTTAGAWVGSNRANTSAQANWIGTASSTFYITGVQLEQGSTATEFERRPIGTELALCQRYYEVGYLSSDTTATSAVSRWTLQYKQVKRASPINVYTIVTGQNSTQPTTLYANASSAVGFSNGATVGDYTIWTWTSSAEL